MNQSEGRWAGRCTHTHIHTHYIGCNYTGKLIDCSANVGTSGGTVISPIEAERVTLLSIVVCWWKICIGEDFYQLIMCGIQSN